MKIAIMKMEAAMPGNFHYFIHPMDLKTSFEEAMYKQMGYIVVDVNEEDGKRLISQAKKALSHQVEVAVLAEKELEKGMSRG